MKKIYAAIVLLFITAIVLYSCKKTFEYSPYSGKLPGRYTELTTAKNIERIQAANNQSGTFKIAFISDTHYFHDELSAAVDQINTDNSISFVVICGDLSDQGMEKEYMFFYDQLKRLNKPVLTVIGNHDYLANAENIYADMFGATNYTLDHKGYRFIFFDNVFWEKNATPDFGWLNDAAAGANTNGLKPILISHIPYFGDQYDEVSKQKEFKILRDNNIMLSVHGHAHSYSYGNIFDDADNKCLVVPTVGKRSYSVVTFNTESPPSVQPINF